MSTLELQVPTRCPRRRMVPGALLDACYIGVGGKPLFVAPGPVT
jgi:hypothetical protein